MKFKAKQTESTLLFPRRVLFCKKCQTRSECEHVTNLKENFSGWRCVKCREYTIFDREEDE